MTRMGLTSRKNFSVVLRHGRTCSKMRGTILRIGKQKDGATFQSFHPCLDDHRIKKEELENKGELSQVCSQNCLEMLVLDTNCST